jgi:quinol monooxygenase YgiN
VPPVVLVVASRLRSSEDREAFLDASRDFYAWLRERPGFEAYEVVGAGRHWADRIQWSSMEAATAGNADFATTAMAARFAAVVEHYTAALGPLVDLEPVDRASEARRPLPTD